jgi:hypothetical protein
MATYSNFPMTVNVKCKQLAWNEATSKKRTYTRHKTLMKAAQTRHRNLHTNRLCFTYLEVMYNPQTKLWHLLEEK